MSAVHQVIAGAAPRDAITHHVMRSRELIRGMGLRSEVFVDDRHIDPELAGRVHPASAWQAVARPDDRAMLHYSISSPAFWHVLERAGSCALMYQNITPARLLWRDAPLVALECERGRRALPGLLGRVDASAGHSAFTAAEIAGLGFPDPDVVGVLWPALPDPGPLPRADDGRLRLLFVGRGIPNKAQHDLIATLASLVQAGADAELALVGAWAAAPLYEARCRALAADLRVDDRVAFLGSVDDAELGRRYREADVFVCLSDHEGLCLPVVEALAHELPVVAYAAAALPETVGGAGVLLPEKPPSLVAEAILEVVRNPALRASLAEGRAERLAALAPERIADQVRGFAERIA